MFTDIQVAVKRSVFHTLRLTDLDQRPKSKQNETMFIKKDRIL